MGSVNTGVIDTPVERVAGGPERVAETSGRPGSRGRVTGHPLGGRPRRDHVGARDLVAVQALDVQLRLHPDPLAIVVAQGASAILVGVPLAGQAGSNGPPASTVRWIGWCRSHGVQAAR
jgi:hypothetical protein